MTGNLTMAKWDTFTVLLKDYYLDELYNNIYMKRKKDQNTKTMKELILMAAEEWKLNKPYMEKEIINKIIDTIKIDEITEWY